MEEMNDDTLKCIRAEKTAGELCGEILRENLFPISILALPIVLNYWYLTPVVYAGYKIYKNGLF